jgi:transglutaminase-like putative cysteine protease
MSYLAATRPGYEPAWNLSTQLLRAGDLGVEQTVTKMAGLARESMMNPAVREFAYKAAKRCKQDQTMCIAQAVTDSIRRAFFYIRDPHRIEHLTAPYVHVARIAATGEFYGDCDDLVMMQSAVLGAVGIPTRMEAIATGKKGPAFNHARALAHVLDRWFGLDFLMPSTTTSVRKPLTVEV